MNEAYFWLGILVGALLVFVGLAIWANFLMIKKANIEKDIAVLKKETEQLYIENEVRKR